MPKVPYTKPALSYADQLQLLKDRGLSIGNDAKALHLLETISYYRLSGYLYPMLDNPKSPHIFKPGSTFKNGFKLYCFDRELRKLILSELEKIEIAVRACKFQFNYIPPFQLKNISLDKDKKKIVVCC
jgi:abortive infection bacteriophage resistance protein